jgi:hypothetical protein
MTETNRTKIPIGGISAVWAGRRSRSSQEGSTTAPSTAADRYRQHNRARVRLPGDRTPNSFILAVSQGAESQSRPPLGTTSSIRRV